MRKINLFSALLILFLLVPASITWAQVSKTINGTVKYESGMSKTTFETPKGAIIIRLPQSLSGATITGTVSTEPDGKTEKEKSRNLKELLKYIVMLDGQKIPTTASATNFDWLTHMDRQSRTPVELLNVSGTKVAELSLPPVLIAPSIFNSGNVPRLSTPSNILVKGDVLNVYTDQQFKPGEKFILTDSKGQQFTVRPLCLSNNQAIIKVPDEVVVGGMTINQEVWNFLLNSNNKSKVEFNLVDINLSSPNTNLRSGQTSSVTVVCNQSNNATILGSEREMFLNIDLRNLNPNSVSMAGGNLQRLSFPLNVNQQDASFWRVTRSITGIKPGNFSVSATLHEDYNTSNDPFRPQLNVLKAPVDFNEWADALKKDLKEYGTLNQADAGAALNSDVVRFNVQRAIDNMSVCISPEQLDECKAVTYSLLKTLNIPKGAAIYWISSFIAAKAAIKSIDNSLAGNKELVDYDVIRNAVAFAGKATGSDVFHIQQLIEMILQTSETNENLQDLKNKFDELFVRTNATTGAGSVKGIKYKMQDLVISSPSVASRSGKSKDALITEIGFPSLDASSKDPMMISLKILPDENSYEAAINKYHSIQPKEKKWLVSNFKITLGDLPVNQITKLDLPKVTIKTSDETLKISELKIQIPASDIGPWQDWYNSYQKQFNTVLKNGSVEYNGQDGKPLFTVSMNKVKPISIHPDTSGNFTVSIQPGETSLHYNPMPGILFNINTGTYIANEIAGNPCKPEGATTYTWLYIEKPCRVEMATTRSSNIDPEAEDILNDIQDLLKEVSEDGAELGEKLAKTFSIGKSFAVWMRVVRDWESYKAEYVCRNGVWQHGYMKLVNSGVKEIVGWQLFRGLGGEDSWTEKDDIGWIRRNIPESISSVCNKAIR